MTRWDTIVSHWDKRNALPRHDLGRAFFRAMLGNVRTGREQFADLKTGPHKMKPTTLIPPELLTKKQVAEYLQCSQRQVELLTHKSRLPKPFYLGESSPRWRRDALLTWLDSQASGGAQ